MTIAIAFFWQLLLSLVVLSFSTDSGTQSVCTSESIRTGRYRGEKFPVFSIELDVHSKDRMSLALYFASNEFITEDHVIYSALFARIQFLEYSFDPSSCSLTFKETLEFPGYLSSFNPHEPSVVQFVLVAEMYSRILDKLPANVRAILPGELTGNVTGSGDLRLMGMQKMTYHHDPLDWEGKIRQLVSAGGSGGASNPLSPSDIGEDIWSLIRGGYTTTRTTTRTTTITTRRIAHDTPRPLRSRPYLLPDRSCSEQSDITRLVLMISILVALV